MPFYFISRFKFSKTFLVGAIVSIPFILVAARPFAILLASYSGSDAYMAYAESEYENDGALNLLLFILASAFLVLFSKKHKEDSIPDIWVNAMSLTVIFIPLMWVDMSLMRVIQYFAIFTIISLPLAIDNIVQNKTVGIFLFWFVFLVLLATTVRHNYEYGFFWEDMNLIY